jgi:hypothetical protein
VALTNIWALTCIPLLLLPAMPHSAFWASEHCCCGGPIVACSGPASLVWVAGRLKMARVHLENSNPSPAALLRISCKGIGDR